VRLRSSGKPSNIWNSRTGTRKRCGSEAGECEFKAFNTWLQSFKQRHQITFN